MKQDVVLQLASTYLQLLGLLVQSKKKKSLVFLLTVFDWSLLLTSTQTLRAQPLLHSPSLPSAMGGSPKGQGSSESSL